MKDRWWKDGYLLVIVAGILAVAVPIVVFAMRVLSAAGNALAVS